MFELKRDVFFRELIFFGKDRMRRQKQNTVS